MPGQFNTIHALMAHHNLHTIVPGKATNSIVIYRANTRARSLAARPARGLKTEPTTRDVRLNEAGSLRAPRRPAARPARGRANPHRARVQVAAVV